MYSIKNYILYAAILLVIAFFLRTLFSILTSANESRMEKARKKQLDSQANKQADDHTEKMVISTIDKVTAPVINNVLTIWMPKNLIKTQRKLKVAGWDKFFSPIQWHAFVLMLQVVGVVLGITFFPQSSTMGIIMFVAFAIFPSFILNNSYNNRTDEILLGFPEAIRIIAGYLSAGIIFKEAVLQSVNNVNPSWQPLLEGLAAKCDTEGTSAALDWFKEEIDIMEAREFISIVRLNIELGNSAKSGFIEQADKIQELLRTVMQKKIEKRKVWATAIQAPIFATIIGAFALPTVGSLMDIF